MFLSACVSLPGHDGIEPQSDDTFPYAFEYTYDDKKNKYRYSKVFLQARFAITEKLVCKVIFLKESISVIANLLLF